MLANSACFPRKLLNNLHIMEPQRAFRRFTRTNPCPICGGHDGLGRGRGVRCFGYYLGKSARCTREERVGSLPQNRDGTYPHRLFGPCECGRQHGEAMFSTDRALAAASNSHRRKAERRFRSFFTLEAFLRRHYGAGTSIRHWTYRDATGYEVFRVLRVDYLAPDGSNAKSYRPCHNAADGRWLLSRPEGKLPLYNLPSILAAPPDATIAVLEGEKCADLAASIGLPHATASAHGAKAPWLSDWSPLASRRVAILGDEDADGAGYAAQVASLLAELDPPAEARIVRLPGLSDGEDIEQWVENRRNAGLTPADLLAELVALIELAR